MESTEASWWNNLNLKIYATLGYIVLLILLNLGHVFRFRIVLSSRGLVKQYNQELCISSKNEFKFILEIYTGMWNKHELSQFILTLQLVQWKV